MLSTSHTIEEKNSKNMMDRYGHIFDGQGHIQRTNKALGTSSASYAGGGFVQFMKLW